MKETILSYYQEDSIKLLCETDLKKLLPVPKQRERFNNKWNDFLESDSYNKITEAFGETALSGHPPLTLNILLT